MSTDVTVINIASDAILERVEIYLLYSPKMMGLLKEWEDCHNSLCKSSIH